MAGFLLGRRGSWMVDFKTPDMAASWMALLLYDIRLIIHGRRIVDNLLVASHLHISRREEEAKQMLSGWHHHIADVIISIFGWQLLHGDEVAAVNGQLHIRCLNIFSRPVVSELGGEAAHGRYIVMMKNMNGSSWVFVRDFSLVMNYKVVAHKCIAHVNFFSFQLASSVDELHGEQLMVKAWMKMSTAASNNVKQ
ncbi:hypothetical protein Dimus_010499 [Dionaea muscipula]